MSHESLVSVSIPALHRQAHERLRFEVGQCQKCQLPVFSGRQLCVKCADLELIKRNTLDAAQASSTAGVLTTFPPETAAPHTPVPQEVHAK